MQTSKDSKSGVLIMGAVAYDPKVVTIWNGFRSYFAEHGLAFDYVLFSNYERQVIALFSGHIHVAWNSPLAWIQSERLAGTLGRSVKAIAMRDSDCDLTSVILVRADSGIQQPGDLKGKRVAVGASDSPQATLIPLSFLEDCGLKAERDFQVVRFEVLPGLHGDHIGGERDAARSLLRGEADAACVLESNHRQFIHDKTLPRLATVVLARTPRFDHCNFTALDNAPEEQISKFRELLLAMNYDDPRVRPLLDLEGLREWRPGRVTGYAALAGAVDKFDTINEFLKSAGTDCR